MKTKLGFISVAMAATTIILSSCASTGAASASTAKSVHPRSYVIDLGESKTGLTINVPKNPYDDTNYQSDPGLDFTKFVKSDKPQAGDTVTVNYKFSASIDISQVKISLIDPTVNYWLELAEDDFVTVDNVKAGEIYEGSKDIVLANKVSGEFRAYITYDNKDQLADGIAKVGAPSTFTLYDIEGVTTTNTDEEQGIVATVGPKTITVEINKIAAFCEMATGHPWINGVQDMSQIENYQADVSIMSLLDDTLEPGDTLIIKWRARADRDISRIICWPIDHSKEVGYWKELIDDRSDENTTLVENIVAGEVFETEKVYVIDTASKTKDVNLRLFYAYEPDNNPGPSTIIGVNN